MELGAYLTFALLAFSIIASPGPNLLLVLHHSVGGNITLAGSAIAGICVSLIIHACLALFGLSLLITGIPDLLFLVKVIGAIYVLYLGTQALKAFRRVPVVLDHGNGQCLTHRPCKAFKEGFFVGVLNPFTGIFIITVTPQFLVGSNNPVVVTLGVLMVTMVLIYILWFGSLAVMLAKLNVLVNSNIFARFLNLSSGVVLIVLGVVLMRRALM